MQEVLISIQPQWVEKILNGEKTIEIRKTMPKCKFPCKVYIYCTKPKKWYAFSSWGCTSDELLWKTKDKVKMCNGFGAWDEDAEKLNGKVVAEFTLNNVERFDVPYPAYFYKVEKQLQHIVQGSCLPLTPIHHYLKNDSGYAWHIDNLKIYDIPKELSEFSTSSYCSNYIKNVDVTINALGDYVAHYEDNFICRKCKYFDGDFNICEKKESALKRPPQSWCYVRGRI